MKILATSFDYRPNLGGVATCAYEMSRTLASLPGVELRMLAPESAQREKSNVDVVTYRVPSLKVRGRAWLALPQMIWSFRKEINTFKPDVLLHFIWHPDAFAASLALGKQYIPQFSFLHGVELLESKSTWAKRLRGRLAFLKQKILNQQKGLISVSHYTRDLAIQAGVVDANKIFVIHNGVDPRNFYPGPKPKSLVSEHGTEGRIVFLTVARLSSHKGIDQAIRAFSTLVQTHPELRTRIKYLICGEGAQKEHLLGLIENFKLSDVIEWVGSPPANQLLEYYQLSDCFLLLSREDFKIPAVEGFGIVFLEAAACGKPSIAGKSGGIADAVLEGQTGWLVDPLDLNAIQELLLRLISQPQLIKEMGERALSRALTLTWDHQAKLLFKVLSEGRPQ